MKVFKVIGIAIIAMIAGFFIWAIFLPSEVKVEKKVVINASIEKVFGAVNDFKQWQKWSPWADTNFVIQFTDITAGLGAKITWQSDRHGIGEMTTVEWIENKFIRNEIFYPKTKSKSSILIHLNKLETGVEVTISTENKGYSYPFGRFAALLIQRGLNSSFEKGLLKLKAFVENKDFVVTSSKITVEVIGCEPRMYLAITDSGTEETMPTKFKEHTQEIDAFMNKNKIESCGFPISFWYAYNPNSYSHFAVAVPISKHYKTSGNIKLLEMPATKAAFVTYIGNPNGSYLAWNTLDKYCSDNNLKDNGAPWEEYIIAIKQNADSSQWVTNIYKPVK